MLRHTPYPISLTRAAANTSVITGWCDGDHLQPSFYPVLNEDDATRIARDWSVK